MTTINKKNLKKCSYVLLFSLTLFSQTQAETTFTEDLIDDLEKKPVFLHEIYGVHHESEIETDLRSAPQDLNASSKTKMIPAENEKLYLDRLYGLDNNFFVQQSESLINLR